MFKRLAQLREKRENGESGFTLIELLVVVVIIGILIAIAIPLYLNYRKGANDKAAQSDLRGAISTLEQCNSDNSSYPVTADVPAAGGAITTGTCTGAKINASSGTTFVYTATGTPPTSYMMTSTNGSGSGKIFCFNSLNGGSVKALVGTATTC